jgi:drug/metabolite transporter (DMT)-like permease
MERSDQTVGIVFALTGALLFSTKAIFVKLAYQDPVDTVSFLLLRMVFALPFYLFMIFRVMGSKWKEWSSLPALHWLGLIIAAGLGYYLSSLLDFLGLQYIGASIERLILFIYPTFIALISFFVFRERITRLQAGALALSYVGLLFVFGRNLQSITLDSDFWKGAFLILGCALTFAIFLVMSQWLIPKFGATSFTSLSMTVACFFVIGHFISVREGAGLLAYPPRIYGYALAMATIATVIPSYVVNYAIQRIGATRSAILASVGPISTISLAYLLLGERLIPAQIAGAVLIILGVTVVSIEMKRTKVKTEKARTD